MPELPEVEVVRRGLEAWVVGRPLGEVTVLNLRAVRRHVGGPAHFADLLAGRTITAAHRRGKYLWLPLDSGDVLLGHLGMSGQLLVQQPQVPDETHLRVRFRFADEGSELRFVDQRTFGGLAVESDADGLPRALAHIAADPLDPDF
ncbi:MAG: formamidopyrimidine-DNA glycosylase, partial [Cryptosporangiaceae bacterium]|nr:formamidopyrimidine-DNA glycosylase [Cryptosporangiaceae bacterium]